MLLGFTGPPVFVTCDPNKKNADKDLLINGLLKAGLN